MEIKVDNKLKVYDNIKQNIICIEEYRMKDYLREFQDSIIAKPELYTSIGLFITLLTTIITAKFQDLGLSAPTWQAIFIILCGASLVWLIYNIVQYIKYKKNKKTIDVVMTNLLSSPNKKATS